MLQNIRAFFDTRDVLEVETPLMSAAATTDPHLSSFVTHYQGRPRYLNTSPEFAMKRLLATHGQAIYQVSKSFREDEFGPMHNPEFTLLEWYRPGYDMFQLMQEVNELMTVLMQAQGKSQVDVVSMSYADAFEKATGLNPHVTTAPAWRSYALEQGIEQPVGLEDDVDEWLDWLLTQCVLPSFGSDCFTYIYDYPASQCALAKCRTNEAGQTVACRFELIYGELELANGFDELQDSEEQRRRITGENRIRQAKGMQAVDTDEYFLSALQHGLPQCSGVAVGLDRLLMLLTDSSAIHDVLAFPFDRS